MSAIAISGLVKDFGPRMRALDHLDLEVRTGEVHGFLGPNGAGKTTTIRVLLGLLRADAGRVALLGVVVGVLAALGLTTYIQALLFNVGRLDVTAFAGMSAVLVAVALVASYLPARRASRVDPVVALRTE